MAQRLTQTRAEAEYSDPFRSSASLESGHGSVLQTTSEDLDEGVLPSVMGMIGRGDRTTYGGVMVETRESSNVAQNSHSGSLFERDLHPNLRNRPALRHPIIQDSDFPGSSMAQYARGDVPEKALSRVENVVGDGLNDVNELVLREERLHERLERALESNNTMLAFIAIMSLLVAVTSILFLSYNTGSIPTQTPNDDGTNSKATNEIISGCLLVSLILALISAAVSGITHSGVLTTLATGSPSASNRMSVTRSLRRISSTTNQTTPSAIQSRLVMLQGALLEVQSHDDALYWFVCFLCPSLVALLMGVMIYVWSERALGVAVAVSVALVYGLVQAARVVMALAKAIRS